MNESVRLSASLSSSGSVCCSSGFVLSVCDCECISLPSPSVVFSLLCSVSFSDGELCLSAPSLLSSLRFVSSSLSTSSSFSCSFSSVSISSSSSSSSSSGFPCGSIATCEADPKRTVDGGPEAKMLWMSEISSLAV